jgi:hypothetical protein
MVQAGFVAPLEFASPRIQVDAIIVQVSQADELANEIARLGPVDLGGTALEPQATFVGTIHEVQVHR